MNAQPSSMIPRYELDFYSDEFIDSPYPHSRVMRDLGAAVWLPKNDSWALTRYDQVRDSLRNSEVFICGQGVMLNDATNLGSRNSILCMDDPQHKTLRQLMIKPLTPLAMAELGNEMQQLATARVEELVARGTFDGVADFAHYLPLTVVSRLVGLPENGRTQMLEWANGIFNTMGPISERWHQGAAMVEAVVGYIQTVRKDILLPGSWGARLLECVESGVITDAQARSMSFDYIAPALDTTINATSSALWLFGENPDQWDLLRENPALIGAAIDEVIRLETPIRAFSRLVARDFDIGGITLPAGARALVVYASANRDERKWAESDRFDIRRKTPHDQLGFGTGIHLCVGMHLAKLEMRSLFSALASRVRRFTVGKLRRHPHNILRGPVGLDVTITEIGSV